MPFAFSTAAGTAISIGDVDAGYNLIQLSLSVSQGVIKFGSIVGLTFVNGTSNNSSTVVIQGRLDLINFDLQTLTYTPSAIFTGSDTLNISVSDLGLNGRAAFRTASVMLQL